MIILLYAINSCILKILISRERGRGHVKMADELKFVFSRSGYKDSIPSLPGTGNKRIEAFIKLIVEELK